MHMPHLQNRKQNAEITADTRNTITDIQVRNLVLKFLSCILFCNDYICTYLPIWNIWHQPSLNNLRNSCTWNQSCMSPLRLNVHSPLHHIIHDVICSLSRSERLRSCVQHCHSKDHDLWPRTENAHTLSKRRSVCQRSHQSLQNRGSTTLRHRPEASNLHAGRWCCLLINPVT